MATTDDTQANNRLSERLRSGLILAQTRIHTMETRAKTQWGDLPMQVRAVVDRALARLRTTLDLPSRAEVVELVDRMDAIDRKLVALEKRQARRAAATNAETATSAETAASAEVVPEAAETARKTVKSTSAGKTVKAAAPTERPAGRGGAAKKAAPAQQRKKGRRGGDGA
jgi:hypothetical protein